MYIVTYFITLHIIVLWHVTIKCRGQGHRSGAPDVRGYPLFSCTNGILYWRPFYWCAGVCFPRKKSTLVTEISILFLSPFLIQFRVLICVCDFVPISPLIQLCWLSIYLQKYENINRDEHHFSVCLYVCHVEPFPPRNVPEPPGPKRRNAPSSYYGDNERFQGIKIPKYKWNLKINNP